MIGVQTHAKAGRETRFEAELLEEDVLFQSGTYPFSHRERAGGIGVGQDNDELVTTVATDDVFFTHDAADESADFEQTARAAQMTISVIDTLEPVKVEKQDGQLAFLLAGTLEGFFEKTV